jgi:hypothetical protein
MVRSDSFLGGMLEGFQINSKMKNVIKKLE